MNVRLDLFANWLRVKQIGVFHLGLVHRLSLIVLATNLYERTDVRVQNARGRTKFCDIMGQTALYIISSKNYQLLTISRFSSNTLN